MLDFIDRISDLSNYSFKLGIATSTINVSLTEESSASSDDFLHMLENGSPLNMIVATRPIERTWLTMRDMMQKEYDDCIDMIIKKDVDQTFINDRMRMLGQRLSIRLKDLVDQRIRNDITCQVFYKGRKIN